jgi:diadenosine tetraphosphate (Ap4A) HIT family hydrolase
MTANEPDSQTSGPDREKVAAGPTCAFCTLVLAETGRPLLDNSRHVVAFEDAYPSAPGHTLVIPRRHVERIRDLNAAEQKELWNVALTQIERLERDSNHDGYTIGVNDGQAAGQTVPHVHLHVIPRTHRDVPDPRGGVRWVIPQTASYWNT